MTDEEAPAQSGNEKHNTHKRSLRERVHDRLVAAEVAAEEAAGYGWATEAVEATEAAVDPARELRDRKTKDGGDAAAEPQGEPKTDR